MYKQNETFNSISTCFAISWQNLMIKSLLVCPYTFIFWYELFFHKHASNVSAEYKRKSNRVVGKERTLWLLWATCINVFSICYLQLKLNLNKKFICRKEAQTCHEAMKWKNLTYDCTRTYFYTACGNQVEFRKLNVSRPWVLLLKIKTIYWSSELIFVVLVVVAWVPTLTLSDISFLILEVQCHRLTSCSKPMYWTQPACCTELRTTSTVFTSIPCTFRK